jgi:hypothetical protein
MRQVGAPVPNPSASLSSKSGSLAMLAAMRLASSRVSALWFRAINDTRGCVIVQKPE